VQYYNIVYATLLKSFLATQRYSNKNNAEQLKKTCKNYKSY